MAQVPSITINKITIYADTVWALGNKPLEILLKSGETIIVKNDEDAVRFIRWWMTVGILWDASKS